MLRLKSQQVKRTAGIKDFIKASLKVDVKSAEEAQRFILRAMKSRNYSKGHVVLCYDVNRLADGARTKFKILDLLMPVNGESTRPAKEMKLINQEIASVERVLKALKSKQKVYIPYRDSQVTKVMQDTLTRDGLKSVVITASSKIDDLRITMTALQFGRRCVGRRVIAYKSAEAVQVVQENLHAEEHVNGTSEEESNVEDDMSQRSDDASAPDNAQDINQVNEELTTASPIIARGVSTLYLLGVIKIKMARKIESVAKLRDNLDNEIKMWKNLEQTIETEIDGMITDRSCSVSAAIKNKREVIENIQVQKAHLRGLAEEACALHEEIIHFARSLNALESSRMFDVGNLERLEWSMEGKLKSLAKNLANIPIKYLSFRAYKSANKHYQRA